MLAEQLLPFRVGPVAQVVEHRRLEAAEREVEVVQLRARKVVERRVAVGGVTVDGGPAGVAEVEQLRDLVERLPGGVVAGAAEDRMLQVRLDHHELGVAAAYDQAEVGPGRRRRGQVGRVQVSLQMVDADEGHVEAARKCLGEAEAHNQGAGQARTVGDGDGVEGVGGRVGLIEGRLDHRDDEALMVARGQLRHHPPVFLVQVVLRGPDVRAHGVAVQDGGGRVVTRTFNAEHAHAGRKATERR